MSGSGRNWSLWLKRFLTEDLKIIAIFLFALLTITFFFSIIWGWLTPYGLAINAPSQNANADKADVMDTDGDDLKDWIEEGEHREGCERGDPVYFTDPESGEKLHIGRCTDTDAEDMDTDNDGFTDNIENALGTNPTNPWNPGWVYIIWFLGLVVVVANRFIKGDPLKEYKQFEEQRSGGVADESKGKFAYGSSSPFSKKKASEMTEEEKREAIESDKRFQKIAADDQAQQEAAEKERQQQRKQRKRKKNIRLLIQAGVAIVLGLLIFLIARYA